jgi:hypothetical protein
MVSRCVLSERASCRAAYRPPDHPFQSFVTDARTRLARVKHAFDPKRHISVRPNACRHANRRMKNRKVSLSIPCYAERRYGGVADDEMLMACPPEDLQRAVTGLHYAIRSCRSGRRPNPARGWQRATPANPDP